jgi:hypothetical protein
MGPISGFRIVNLRVKNKAAYPDLGLDLGDDHVVIGLENGGGKSTLIGFVLHVIVPSLHMFLPRLAQRRQSKKGKEKQIEHYVPVNGAPTHVVIELDLPAEPGATPQKVLVGACLYWERSGKSGDKVRETFWSARCVAEELTLTGLGIRGQGGRLLDHQEWAKWLETMLARHPDAEILTTTKQYEWEAHLTNRLKVDVGFVKSWLLKMNEDEGAADHVFTFGSDRDFLDSLIDAVAPPEMIEGVKTELAARALDSESLNVDRKRVTVLTDYIAAAAPLAQLAEQVRDVDATRISLVDGAIGTTIRLGSAKKIVNTRAELCREKEQAERAKLTETTAARSRAAVQEVLARRQYADLQVRESETQLEAVTIGIADLESHAACFEAAAVLAAQRTAEHTIREAQNTLESRTTEAEPLRRQAASAALAWRQGLEDELERVSAAIRIQQQQEAGSKAADHGAQRQRTNAIKGLQAAEQDLKHALGELARLTMLLTAAAERHDLEAGQEPIAALEKLRHRTSALRTDHTQAMRSAEALQAQTNEILARHAEIGRNLATGQQEARSAAEDLERMRRQTDDLVDAIVASDLLDDPAISLDDAAPLIGELLAAVAQSAHADQLDAAVQSAALRRSNQALETSGLLPPRPDVAAICQHAAAQGLGVRSGWSYLAHLDPQAAERFAAEHPELADGIVVNIPDDLDAALALLRTCRPQLTGPVAIGVAAAFDEPGPSGAIHVVLPDEAYWSRDAGQQVLARTREAHRTSERTVAASATRYDTALTLRTRLSQWAEGIGPGAREKAELALADLHGANAALAAQHAALGQQAGEHQERRAHALASAGRLSAEADQLAQRETRLATLADRLEDRPRFLDQQRHAERDVERFRGEKATASRSVEKARAALAAARQALSGLKEQHSELRFVASQAAKLAASVARNGDQIYAEDALLDRATLADLAETRAQVWNGTIDEPELRATISTGKKAVGEATAKLARLDPASVHQATALLEADPTRTPEDYERENKAATASQSELSERKGSLGSDVTHRQDTLAGIEAQYEQLPARGVLDPAHHAETLTAAANTAAQLATALRAADQARSEQEAAYARATAAVTETEHCAETIAECAAQLTANVIGKLAAHSPFMALIDPESREFDLDEDQALSEAPHQLNALVRLLTEGSAGVDLRGEARALLTEIAEEADAITRSRARIEVLTGKQLSTVEAILRNADHEAFTGHKLLLTLRSLPREALLERVAEHLVQAGQRLSAVADAVAKFDKKLESSAKNIFASLQYVLRAVDQTVQVSELPDTPAMGRWAGLPLLKLTGLGRLKKEEKYSAILGVLRTWYDPDVPGTRPELNATATVMALVEAMTPGFRAKVLIPSDTLDPEHKPVDELSKETSGGEGVTFALLLASLLAARRAAQNGHQRTTLLLDNPFSKLTKPTFLRLVRDVSTSLGVQIVALTGIKDAGALTVFPNLIQLRLSRRKNARFVVPDGTDEDQLKDLLHEGMLYVSATERDAARDQDAGNDEAFPTISSTTVHRSHTTQPDTGETEQ